MKKYISIFFIPAFIFLSLLCAAQDSLLVSDLLKRIAAQQIKEDNYFLPGIFPSYITSKEIFSNRKKDNNIFFNGLIAYTLNDIKRHVTEQNRLIIDSILANAKPLFAKFKNRKGRDTYNFWRTDTAYDYPYASFIRFFGKKTTLPDDMDDTVLSLLALDADDPVASNIHALMQDYVNSDTNKVRSVINTYNNFPAYSTWFGKKFPVVFDISVLCNILSFVQLYNLQWTKADSASLDVILKTIENNYHINQPVYASPYYAKTSTILYHIARLMSIKKIPQLEQLKVKLITDAVNEFAHSNNLMEKTILSIAILKWGYVPPSFVLPAIADVESNIEKNDFCFFVGNVPSYFHDMLRKYATGRNMGLFYHYCPAWNDVLLLEYLVLRTNNHIVSR
ncbi:MAG TPA: hypothetical protein VH396_20960 [Chitinophagaceae bacterium]|jgi:hypothetical protein